YPVPRTLRALALHDLTATSGTKEALDAGPGTTATLDAELGEVALYLDDGNGSFDPARDALLFRANAMDTTVRFKPLWVSIPASSTARLFVSADVPVSSRDGDVLDVDVRAADDVSIDDGVAAATWPVSPSGGFPIDGLVAAQVAIAPVAASAVGPGTVDRL